MRTNIRDRLLSGGKGPVLMFSYHHSLVHTFFFFSQYIPVVLQPTFMHFFYISHTFVVPVIVSFLILSRLVTSLIHLIILISAISNLMPANSCSLRTVERLMHSHRLERLSSSTQRGLPAKMCTTGARW